jgi:colicin import membrane protein
LNSKATPHLEFAPPPPPGQRNAWLVAGLAHAALFVALGLATAWKTQPQTLQAEAELWSAVPQAAAPRLQEPPPKPAPETPPKPPTQKIAPTPPPPPAPDPKIAQRDAQIALEKQKQLDQKKEAEKRQAEKAKADKAKAAQEKADKLKAERQRQEREKIDKAREEKLAKEKAAKDEAAKEKLAQEKQIEEQKQAAEKAQALRQAEASRAEALRQENLKRMQGMAGASGGENATGTALRSSGPSASYAGRLVARIKPNITYSGEVAGNPRAEVEVRVLPDGAIQSRRIVLSSGNKAWDDAVLRAIDKTEIFPKDTDGRIPPVIVLGFRPQD